MTEFLTLFNEPEISNLKRFGFKDEKGSVMTKRTIMLSELVLVLEKVDSANAVWADYSQEIIAGNCLKKKTENNKKYTAYYLQDLYGLDKNVPLFRSFYYFYTKDKTSLPQLAILLAYSRDQLLRNSHSYILKLNLGEKASKEAFEKFIDQLYPNRFGTPVLHSMVRNLLSCWSQSGHLLGRSNKVRTSVVATPVAVAYALLLGYLQGARGEFLFQSDYTKLLDCSKVKAIEMTEIAAARGWLNLKKVGNIIEVLFPNLITKEEMEWLRE